VGNNNISLRHEGVAGESGTIRLGAPGFIVPSSPASAGAPVVVNATGQLGVQASSLRYKEEIRDMADARHDLLKLRPVTFRYKPQAVAGAAARPREFGLIAEEVAAVYPELVWRAAGRAVMVGSRMETYNKAVVRAVTHLSHHRRAL
jgi:hypothetical protein